MSFVSYAQNFEDIMLWRALGHVENGFYIDVGAHDPNQDSVTRAFYERGWNGINIDPLPAFHGRLNSDRRDDINLCCAVGESKGTTVLYELDHTSMSTSSKDVADLHIANGHKVTQRSVEVATLADICARHSPKDIHFLKIDVEGAEREVLAGADFVKFRPWVVLLEATEPNSPTPNHHGWEPLLIEAGYDFVWFDGLNRFYVSLERMSELGKHFKVPPNIFDDFVLNRNSEASAANVVTHCDIESDYAQHTVSTLYRSILLREADPDGLTNFAQIITDNGDISKVIYSLLTSEEFRTKLPQFLRHYNLSLRECGGTAAIHGKEPPLT